MCVCVCQGSLIIVKFVFMFGAVTMSERGNAAYCVHLLFITLAIECVSHSLVLLMLNSMSEHYYQRSDSVYHVQIQLKSAVSAPKTAHLP